MVHPLLTARLSLRVIYSDTINKLPCVLARKQQHGHPGHTWIPLPAQITFLSQARLDVTQICITYPDFGSLLFEVPKAAKILE